MEVVAAEVVAAMAFASVVLVAAAVSLEAVAAVVQMGPIILAAVFPVQAAQVGRAVKVP